MLMRLTLTITWNICLEQCTMTKNLNTPVLIAGVQGKNALLINGIWLLDNQDQVSTNMLG